MTFASSPASAPALESLWRLEMLHPAVVHFPVALLLVGGLFWLGGWAAPVRGRFAYLRPAGTVLLVLGVVGAWLAVLTGFWADDAVGHAVPNAPLLKDHENLALVTAVLATIVVVVDVVRQLFLRAGIRPRLVLAVRSVTAVLIVGTWLSLGLAAHHGAALVYAEGAAVQRVSQ